MAKTLNESPLTTRNARDKLSRGTHWRAIDPDVHLGYRKGVRGGRWLVRWYGGQQKYRQATLGTADDAICEGALSFEAAAKRAREHVSNYRRAVRGVSGGAAPTLRIPVEQYIAMRDARDRAREQRPIRSDASRRLGRYILDDPIADLALHELTDAALRAWRKRLNPKLAHTTTQRLSSDLKAALNAYYLENRKKLPADFAETVRVGLKTPSQEIPAEPKSSQAQMLTDEQVRAVVQAAIEQDVDGDFGRLILVMASTGARFAQVRRLRVEDVQPEFAPDHDAREPQGQTQGDTIHRGARRPGHPCCPKAGHRRPRPNRAPAMPVAPYPDQPNPMAASQSRALVHAVRDAPPLACRLCESGRSRKNPVRSSPLFDRQGYPH